MAGLSYNPGDHVFLENIDIQVSQLIEIFFAPRNARFFNDFIHDLKGVPPILQGSFTKFMAVFFRDFKLI